MKAQYFNEHTDQYCLEFWDRTESLHKAGLPEERVPVKAEHYANGSFPAELRRSPPRSAMTALRK